MGKTPTGEAMANGSLNLEHVRFLIEIATRALAVAECVEKKRWKDNDLGSAYASWKEEHGLPHIERDSEEWSQMMAATSREYAALRRSQKDEYNAKRRLQTSIRKFQSIA